MTTKRKTYHQRGRYVHEWFNIVSNRYGNWTVYGQHKAWFVKCVYWNPEKHITKRAVYGPFKTSRLCDMIMLEMAQEKYCPKVLSKKERAALVSRAFENHLPEKDFNPNKKLEFTPEESALVSQLSNFDTATFASIYAKRPPVIAKKELVTVRKVYKSAQKLETFGLVVISGEYPNIHFTKVPKGQEFW